MGSLGQPQVVERNRAARAGDRVGVALRALDRVPPARMALWLYAIACAILLLVGLAVRFRTGAALLEADESEYLGLSGEIMRGVWAISPRRTLAFPALLAGIRSLWDDLLFLQFVVTAVFALSAPALFALVRRLTGSTAIAAIAALAFVSWPPAIYYGTSLYSETLALPAFLAALALLPPGSRVAAGISAGTGTTGVAALPRAPWRHALYAGLMLGLAAHIRPMYLLFLPVLVLVVLIEEARVGAALRRVAIVLAGFAMVVLPWSLYMSQRYDRVIVLTANGGETLAGGLTPRLLTPAGRYTVDTADRAAWVGPGKWLPIYQNGYLSAEEQTRPYAQTDAMLQKRTFAWIAGHPAEAAFIELRKLSYMWGIYPFVENGTRQWLFGNVPTLLVMALSLAFLMTSRTARVALPRLWMLALFVSGVALISWGSWRFRQPADAGLVAFVACNLCWHLRRRLPAWNGDERAHGIAPATGDVDPAMAAA
jgi:4-amino-4-deoxy-L-arabinose transferase-like glycosyltransferase